jgi:DNA invertase Pin-like site-specific DNA recombinase
VKSQKGEGWRALDTLYDDGGYSGGSMERPALKRLLADIAAGKVDVVVVYKIDRLTRSLADFARIVELFDRHGVTFVSVTQAFNTTSSMGRLTLNVLLSFAQFEREVTGERIRDKIAASKARGMWMGGHVPLGYDLPIGTERALVVNDAEAATVRALFEAYLELDSVHALQNWADEREIRSKLHLTRNGKTMGGQTFSRGALYHLLRNRAYLGLIVHKDKVHKGLHPAIVDIALFDAVQQKLNANVRRHQARGDQRVTRAPLVGRIFDGDNQPMSPSFTNGKRGKPYRYYVSAPLQ